MEKLYVKFPQNVIKCCILFFFITPRKYYSFLSHLFLIKAVLLFEFLHFINSFRKYLNKLAILMQGVATYQLKAKSYPPGRKILPATLFSVKKLKTDQQNSDAKLSNTLFRNDLNLSLFVVQVKLFLSIINCYLVFLLRL